MKITDVKTVLLTGPSGNDPFLGDIRKVRSASFIEIHTDTNLTGIGETYIGYHCPEIVPEIVGFFRPILIGLEEEEIQPRKLWRRMYRCGNFWARSGLGIIVLAGLEGALWDLKGKMLGVPVYELLGGRMLDRIPCYATGCQSDYPWSELTRKIDLYREAGFFGFKVGAGYYDHANRRSFESTSVQAWVDMESEKLETIRRHTGGDFIVCLDGHMNNVPEGATAWDFGMARAVLTALESYDVFFYEEPLNYSDMAGYTELCRSTAIPIAGGECLTTREEFAHYVDRRTFDIGQPDAAYLGIGAFMDVAGMYEIQGKQVATHAWSSGAGVMENIHASFAVPNVAIFETPPLPAGLHTDVYAPGYRFEDGYLRPPETPGLGVILTDEIKNKYPFVKGSGEWNAVPGKDDLL